MRLFIGDLGFTDLQDFDFESPADGDDINTYGWDAGQAGKAKISDNDFRQGLQSVTIFFGGASQYVSYPLTNAEKGDYDKISIQAFFKGIVTGGDYDHRIQFGLSEGNRFANQFSSFYYNIRLIRSGGSYTLYIQSDWNEYTDPAFALRSDPVIYNNVDYSDHSWIGVKLEYIFSTKTMRLYTDRGESGVGSNQKGVWTFRHEHTYTTGSTAFDHIVIQSAAGGTAFDQIFGDDIILEQQVDQITTEITDVLTATCAVQMSCLGGFSFAKRDLQLANYATIKDNMREPIKFWNDDLSRALGEFILVVQQFDVDRYVSMGIERGRVLQKVAANYNAILAEGEVTAVGNPFIDDDFAAFTADLLTKVCTFTDVVGPSTETAVENGNSSITENDFITPLAAFEINDATFTRTIGTGVDPFWHVNHSGADAANMTTIFEFTVPNAATCQQLDITLHIKFLAGALYTDNPEIFVRDLNTPVWSSQLEITNLPDFGVSSEYNIRITDAALIAKIFNGGTTMEVAVRSGITSTTVSLIQCYYIAVKNTYSTLFTASGIKYTVDIRTATRLTFTGQNPQDGGVAQADRYKVADTMSTNMAAIWAAAGITWLAIDMDSATKIDGTDYQSSHVLPIIQYYANTLGWRYWQIGNTLKLKSSHDSTGLTLTEADLDLDPQNRGLNFRRDSSNIVDAVQVFGGGVTSKDTQIADYLTHQTALITDNRVSSEQLADDLVAATLTENKSPLEQMVFRIDYDSMVQDYTLIEHGKLITVNLYSGKLTITEGLIEKITWQQERGGELFMNLTIKVI